MRFFYFLIIIVATTEIANGQQFPAVSIHIDDKAVCDDHATVDKGELAAQLLKIGGVQAPLLRWAMTTSRRPPAFDPMEFIVAYGQRICGSEGLGAQCESADKIALETSSTALGIFVNASIQTPGVFQYTGPQIPADDQDVAKVASEFFSNPNYQIRCHPGVVSNDPAKSSTADSTTPKSTQPTIDLRLRGNADDLNAPNGSDAFKAADKASISYSQDDVKHKRTRVVSGVVGVGVQLSDEPIFAPDKATGNVWVVPYLGIDSNITKASQSGPSVANNTREIGFELYGYSNLPSPYYWTIRPQELWDLADQSRLLTINLKYSPIVLDLINSQHEFDFAPGYWFQWLLDARANHGHYTSLGIRKPSDSHDFDRIGGQGGFELDHTGGKLPWQWTVTETWFLGVSGEGRNVGQFKSIFSFTLDDKKLVGLDFTYTDGRDPDTTILDKSWKVSLGLKY